MSEATEQGISGLEGVLACESSMAHIDGSILKLSWRGDAPGLSLPIEGMDNKFCDYKYLWKISRRGEGAD